VKFGEIEVDPGGESGEHGLRQRTYGPDRDVLPSVEMIAAAIRAYMEFIRAWKPPVQTIEERDRMARYRTFSWAKATAKGPGREQLEIGLGNACAIRFGAMEKGPEETDDALIAKVTEDVMRMKQAADAHLAAQTDFDPGDGFEADALRYAHTVFLAGFAAGGAARAERDFAIVREATKELLSVDLGSEMREAVLSWCVDRAGPKDNYFIADGIQPLDEAAFRAALATALGEAPRIQLMLDREERGLRWREMERRLDFAMMTPEEREAARAKRLAESAMRERWARHQRMRAALTHTIKETWERTLAKTGSGASAGEACIALLRGLEDEVAADERRANEGAA
jgi:hypothetical protein